MRFKITSALVLHRFMKISLRRMFSRSVSGRPLRKPNNFCISPLASDRLFKASISLSVKRCLGYLPSNRLRAYALVVSPQRAAYSAISLWSCGVSLTIRRLVYFGASFSIFFLFIPSIASIKVCNPMRACERSRSPLAYGQTKCVCMTLVFLDSTAIRVYAQARYALGLHQFTDLLYNGFQITQATVIVGHPPLPSVL